MHDTYILLLSMTATTTKSAEQTVRSAAPNPNVQAASSAIQHYDPRKIYDTKEEKDSSTVVWTTKSVEYSLDALQKGQKVSRSPFFEGDPRKRKGNLVFRMSDWELSEYTKCAADIRYFIKHYIKVKRPDGTIGLIGLRDYQQTQVDDLLTYFRVIMGWSRQSGKTVGTAIYLLWRIMFNADKHAALLANKGGTAREVLTKIKSIYVNLPFFLQAGVVGWNGGATSFDNGCTIFTGPATLDALNGRTVNWLYIDEFAFLGKGGNKLSFQKDFLANANPIVSAQDDGQIIISSTPNGKDEFYRIFNDAMKGKNSYKASKVVWWQIPGKDADWAKREISEIGMDKFKIQYELSFDATSDSLLGAKILKSLNDSIEDFEQTDAIVGLYSEFMHAIPDFESIDKTRSAFLISVDLAEGLKQDYSIASVLQLIYNKETKQPEYKLVAYWRSNEVGIEEFAKVIGDLFYNLNPDYSKLLVERNTYGDFFLKCVSLNDLHDIDLEAICKFKRSNDSDSMIKGLRVNNQIKQLGVKAFQSLMLSEKFHVTAAKYVSEIEHFKKNVKGGYEAELGHDDTVMTLVNAGYFISLGEVEYQNWIEDYLELIEVLDVSDELEDAMSAMELKEERAISELPDHIRMLIDVV